MKYFRHVLAALDLGRRHDGLTPGSQKALNRAVWIARSEGASLTLLHSDRADEHWDAEAEGFVLGTAREGSVLPVLEAAVAEVSTGAVETKFVISSETPWLAIVLQVLREGIDVVVAGKRTDTQSDGRKLGVVARKLLRECPCAVWVENPRDSADLSVILAATDLTPVGDRAVELAASVAHASSAKLHIVHSYGFSLEAQLEGAEARHEYELRKRAAALEQIERVLSSTPMAGAAKLHVGIASPTQAILEGVKTLAPGLVVMGTVSRGGIAGVLVGNTAERLMDRIDCALLTVKPKDFVCPISLPERG